MNKMIEMAKNDIKVYASELAELREHRKELIEELELDGKCLVANKELQNLDDIIEVVEGTIEMAMQYLENTEKTGQPI